METNIINELRDIIDSHGEQELNDSTQLAIDIFEFILGRYKNRDNMLLIDSCNVLELLNQRNK